MKKIFAVVFLTLISTFAFAKTYKAFYASDYPKTIDRNARDRVYMEAVKFANEMEDNGYSTIIYFADKEESIVIVEYAKSATSVVKDATNSATDKLKNWWESNEGVMRHGEQILKKVTYEVCWQGTFLRSVNSVNYPLKTVSQVYSKYKYLPIDRCNGIVIFWKIRNPEIPSAVLVPNMEVFPCSKANWKIFKQTIKYAKRKKYIKEQK